MSIDAMKGETPLDEGSFLSLFLKHECELAGFARALLPDWNSVEEALQESSIVMWRKIGQLQSPEEFLPWARVILRFEVLKQRRKFSRDRLVLSDELAELLASESSEEEVASQTERDALAACMGEFPAEHRELLLAPYMGDGRVKQIADATNRSPNSLYKMLGRLRTRLHDCVSMRLSTT